MAIVKVVAASRWTFAKVKANGELTAFLSSDSNGDDRSRIADEFKKQRSKVKKGPRIAATLGSLGDYESGITLLFADAQSDYGILTLFRTAELGLFTSSEVGLLSFALDSFSDRLSSVQHPLERRRAEREAADGGDVAVSESDEVAMYVLDRDLEIVLAWTSDEQRRIALTGLRTRIAERLPAVLEETVRELTAAWNTDAPPGGGVARPVPFLVVRTQPMAGPTGLFIGVRINRYREANSLADAATRFHISPRELEVLALLLEGRRLEEIATLLHITSSTVQDHIRSMVGKTGSRNRSELIAHVLGWEFNPEQGQA